jgi:hypothetical protein
MFASIRRYRVDADAMDELLHMVDTDFAQTVEQMDGFVAYECIDCGDGQLCTVSVFRDRAAAEASAAAATTWVRDTLSSRYDIERLDASTGEVCVSRARQEMLEPAHH